MKLAIIFNGQGAHYEHMGKDFISEYAVARELIQNIEAVTDYPIQNWIDHDIDILSKTQYAQPAIAATSLVIYHSIAPLIPAVSYMAGLSLGEYAALMASQALTIEDGFTLLKARGEIMSIQCENLKNTANVQMIAAINMPLDQIKATMSEVDPALPLYIANYNSPSQIVLGGVEAAVNQFTQLAKEKGYRKILPLKVEGPFHTPLMEDAVPPFRLILNKTAFKSFDTPVISNLTVEPHQLSTIKDNLANHLVQPVQWQQTIDYFVENGVTHLIQIGPGKTLASLLKRQENVPEVLVIDKVEDVQALEPFLNKGV
ncbi:ACP S-malonyltransferase [Fundicoccus culcitae]|uniref:Malonyl CoA-acyl carrier protein transacylase n=1 Tax=Fundicoccus culcitae TaxID=2969821 RepID=A0ABY5P706_9LACT|nr:ACP S-malonyltransferase [Fundicoccus culcitae]UUX34265.1 ACP S-malonyltransferase [Fundicoccus culcitae]